MTALVLSDGSSRAELTEALTHLGRKAAREMHAVGNEALPTPWDKRHAALNELLDRLDALQPEPA